ncbi:MAG TPA: class I SAM-dependent rRNA methyltransferase [Vicinamibacterales bacterium]|jgi:23S rRNA (cytosine1962-C5)-methyltransferase
MVPLVVVSARGESRLRQGHLWIYRSDVAEARASAGDVVQVVGPRSRVLGYALYSDRSQIALRLLTFGDRLPDSTLWPERIQAALAFRESLAIDATAYRLVHGEADLLPSLIVDRYGDYLVVQALSQAVDRLLPELVRILVELTGARGVLARNDPKVRLLEGLDQRVELVHGEIPERVVVREGSIEYEADLWRGQKTGLFLDQRENRAAAAVYARGRLLDCFSYNGGFALQLGRKCPEVTAVDISDDAVARTNANAARNGLTHVQTMTANVFDDLRRREREGERFDTIVLDPPAFAKNKASVPNAVTGYREINRRALKLLRDGGYLITCSCSYNVDEAMFGQILYEAALDAGTRVTIVEKRMQSRDHPVMLGIPETYYLKCLILRRVL